MIKNNFIKRVMAVGISAIFLVSCSTPTDKARQLIEEDLKHSINNWLSYQFKEISKMDTLYSTPFDNKEYARDCVLKDSLENAKFMLDTKEKAKADQMSNQIKALSAQIHKIESTFKKEPIGWSCDITFTSENKLGARETSKYRYSFNKDITKITDEINLTTPPPSNGVPIGQ